MLENEKKTRENLLFSEINAIFATDKPMSAVAELSYHSLLGVGSVLHQPHFVEPSMHIMWFMLPLNMSEIYDDSVKLAKSV